MRIEKSLKIEGISTNHSPEEILEVLYQTLQAHLTEIHDLLFSYHFKKRESVQDIHLDKAAVSLHGLQGSFTATYIVALSNACADLHHEAKEKMKIDFMIDTDRRVLRLRGEEMYEQEQHEI